MKSERVAGASNLLGMVDLLSVCEDYPVRYICRFGVIRMRILCEFRLLVY